MDNFDFRWEGNFLDRPPRGGGNGHGGISGIFLVLFLLILAALSIAGCESRQQDTRPQPQPKKLEQPDFFSLTEALPEPGRYSVHLKWTGYQTDGLWLISRKDPEAGLKGLEALPREKTEYEDATVEAGETYTYYLSTIQPGAQSILATLNVKIPVDVHFSGIVYQGGEITANRVFFDRGAKLVTGGADLTFVANEVLSEDGAIESYPEGQAAPPGTRGGDGGHMIIRVKGGKGVLYVNGRGEMGGVGANGRPGLTGKPGAPGRYGLSTHEKVDVVCGCGELAKRLRQEMEGDLPSAIIARVQFNLLHQQHRCIQETGDGAPGGQGQPGENGGPGSRGGASAELLVQVEDPTFLQVKVSANPGKGGRGGAGGVGGPGGLGGPPGDRALDFFFNCREAAKGPDGPQGAAGANGVSGADGEERPMCLELGVVRIGDCQAMKKERKEKQ